MLELTILIPCRNEAQTVSLCVSEALGYLESRKITGEVLLVDNGSTDASRDIAEAAGARLVSVAEIGYGNAIRSGIKAAKGTCIIMGDCDGSYDFSNLDPILDKLHNGYDLVIGNRYQGGIKQGAMPFLHRYLGVPILSWLGRIRFKEDLGDFHCGLRGFSGARAKELTFQCSGMEFATEIIGRFSDAGLKICQVPVPLRKDRRGHPGHLRTVRDGLRHLLLILFWERNSQI